MDPPVILVDQPTLAPTRKVRAGMVAGAAASLVAWALDEFASVKLPAGMESACAVLILGLIQYFTLDEMQPPQIPQIPKAPPTEKE